MEQDVNVIQEIYADHKKRMSEREEKMLSKSNVDLFFEHCAQRVKALDGTVQGVVQIQVQQLLFNAENPHMPAAPIMPLPASTPTFVQSNDLG